MNILHTTKINIPENKRIELIALLTQTLASTSDLYLQLKQAHWNVKGKEFIALHKLFDEIAEEVEGEVDRIAERITSLGGTALGTLQSIATNTALRTYPTDIFTAQEHIEHLSSNIALLAKQTQDNIKRTEALGDMVSSDLYIALTALLDKNLWFLEAYLQ